MQWFGELAAWWNHLPREMAFFFALPFLVAVAALVAHGFRPSKRH